MSRTTSPHPVYDQALADFQAEHGKRLPGDLGEHKPATLPGTPLLDEVERDGIQVRGSRKQIAAKPATRKPRARR